MRWRWMALAVLMPGVLGAGSAPTGSLRGEITDGRNRIGYAQLIVPALRMGTLADEEGRFSLTGLPAGVQRITVSAVGYAKYETTLTVAAGENPPVRIELTDPRDRIPCDSCFWVDPFQGDHAAPICLDYTGEDWRASTRTRAGGLSLASDPNPCVLQIDLSPKRRGVLVIIDEQGRSVHAIDCPGGGIHTSWTGEVSDGRLLPIGSYRAVFRSGRDTVALDFERVHRPPLR